MSNALVPRPGGGDADDDILAAPTGRKAEPRPGGLRATIRDARDLGAVRRSPYGLRPILVIAWVGLFLNLNGAIGGVAFRQIIRDVNMDFAGFIRYSQFVGFVAIFAVIGIGYYADRHNRIRMVGVGVLIGGFFTGLTATAQSGLSFGLPNLIASAFLIAAIFPVGSLIADYYPPEVRGRVFALQTLFSAVTGTLVPLAAGYTVDAWGWRPIYAISAVPVALIGLLVLTRLREPIRGYMERRALGAPEDVAVIPEEPVSLGEAWRTVFGIRTLRRLFIAGLISAPAATLFGLLASQFFFERYGLSERQIGQVSAVGAIIVLPAIFLSGGVVDRLMQERPERVLRLYGLIGLLGVIPTVLFAFGLPIPVLILSTSLFAFVDALIGPATAVLYAQILPAHVRNVGNAVARMSALSAPIGGFFIGTVQQSYGLRGGMLFCVPFFIVSGLVLLSAAPLFELDMRAAFASNLANEEYRRAKENGRGKLLVCRNIDVQYSGVQVLFDVDFDVEDGEIIALLGTNGAGKSTLLRAIAGLTTASGGAIVLDGRDITFMPPHETAARGVIFMPGGRGIFPGLSVRENLLLGTFLTSSEEETAERLREVFRIFPILAERADSAAGALSGGEQQQLSLAQAFLCKPRLLMIDELSLGLSPAVVGELIEVVRRIHETGVTIIVVEQSVNVALTLAEKAIFMEKGEVKFFGRTADLMNRPDILRAVYVKGTGGAAVAAPSRQRRQELELARPVLEIDHITKRFGGITALDDVSFSLREGEVLGLVGPNGSGKTTLFDIISGYQSADAGHIRYEGVDITSLRPDERAERRLIRRFQDARLFPSLTVYETLLVSLEQQVELKNPILSAIGLPQARRSERRVRARADALIDILDLGSYRDKFVKELSTGLRRIVDIACVLANDPKVLMLDEPSSGIAQAEAEGLAPLLRRVKFETGCSILIIEHDMPLISAVSDELVALDRGRVLLRGEPEVVLNDDQVVESYLGGSEAAIRRSGSLSS
jgi:branched-chain amino acid transport system ATP-binding protein